MRQELSMGLLLVMPSTDAKHDTRKNKKGALKNWEIFPKNTRYLPKIKTNYKALMLTTYQIRPSNYTNKIPRVPWGYRSRQSRHSLRAKTIPGNQLGYRI